MTPQPSPGEGPGLTDTDERVARAIYRMTVKARRWARQANKAPTSGERADLNEDAEDLRLVLKAALSRPPQENACRRMVERLYASYRRLENHTDEAGEFQDVAEGVCEEYAALSPALATEEPTT